jgi:hypothetical protein
MSVGAACRILASCVVRSWLTIMVPSFTIVVGYGVVTGSSSLFELDTWAFFPFLAVYSAAIVLPLGVAGGFVAVLFALGKPRPWNRGRWTAAGAMTGATLAGAITPVITVGTFEPPVLIALTVTGLAVGAVVAFSMADRLERLWLAFRIITDPGEISAESKPQEVRLPPRV